MATKTLSDKCMDVHDYLIAIERNRQLLEYSNTGSVALEVNAKLYEYGLDKLKELLREARRVGDLAAVWIVRSIFSWLSEAEDAEFWEGDERPAFLKG